MPRKPARQPAAPRMPAAAAKPPSTAGRLVSGAPGPQGPIVIADARREAEALKAAGGNMSAAELAALIAETSVVPTPLTASDALSSGKFIGAGEHGGFADDAQAEHIEATAEELGLAARVLTLEQQVKAHGDALEKLAQMVGDLNRPAAVPRLITASAAVSVRPATAEESAAYCATNFALSQLKEPQYDGIQAWRDAGSPVLTPKPVPAKAGRAA